MGDEIEPIYRRLGAEIRDLRIARGLTQGELAERIGMSRGSVANTEVGRQRLMLHQIADVADALGVTFAQVVADAVGAATSAAQYRAEIAALNMRVKSLEAQIDRAKQALQ